MRAQTNSFKGDKYMHAGSIRSSFHETASFSRTIKLADVERRYGPHFEVLESTDGFFELKAPAIMKKYAANNTQPLKTDLTVKIPDHLLVIDRHGHWPFEGLRQSNIDPAYNDLANRIARHVMLPSELSSAQYGVIPGDFVFSEKGEPIFIAVKRPNDVHFVLFYADVSLDGFAGHKCYNMLQLKPGVDKVDLDDSAGGIYLMTMPIARVDSLLSH